MASRLYRQVRSLTRNTLAWLYVRALFALWLVGLIYFRKG